MRVAVIVTRADDRASLRAVRCQLHVDIRNARREILRDHAGAGSGGGRAMDRYGGAGGFEGRHALGEQSGGKAGQHVAGARGGEPGRHWH
jgi:hypothetical protein